MSASEGGENQRKASIWLSHFLLESSFSSRESLSAPRRLFDETCCGLFFQEDFEVSLHCGAGNGLFFPNFMLVCLFVTFSTFFLFLIGLESVKVASEVWVKVAATFTCDRRTEQRWRRGLCLPIVFCYDYCCSWERKKFLSLSLYFCARVCCYDCTCVCVSVCVCVCVWVCVCLFLCQ